jgi:hypothetical protein
MEVFTWNRARFVFKQAKEQNKDASYAVFEWLLRDCKCKDLNDAQRIATSPKLYEETD